MVTGSAVLVAVSDMNVAVFRGIAVGWRERMILPCFAWRCYLFMGSGPTSFAAAEACEDSGRVRTRRALSRPRGVPMTYVKDPRPSRALIAPNSPEGTCHERRRRYCQRDANAGWRVQRRTRLVARPRTRQDRDQGGTGPRRRRSAAGL